MIFVDIPLEPSRTLMQPDALLVDPQPGGVLAVPQRVSLSITGVESGTTLGPDLTEQVSVASDHMSPSIRQEILARAAKYPDSPHVLNATGQSLLGLRDVRAAIGFFERALTRDPEHRVAQLNLARSLTLLGQFAEAEGIYRRLLRDKGADPRVAQNLAQILMATKRFDEAETLLSEILQGTAHSAGLYNERAAVRMGRGRLREAVHDLRSALRIDPRFAAAHNNLGVCYLLMGSEPRATKAFRAALTVDRTHVDAALNLAHVAEQRGEVESAREVLEDCLVFRPKDFRTLDALARLDVFAGKPRQSLSRLKELLRQIEQRREPPERARILNNMGVASAILGDLEDAKNYFRRSSAEHATNSIPIANLARILLQERKLDEARSALSRATEQNPQDTEALLMLADYYMRTDQVDQAAGKLRDIIELAPRQWLAYAWLGSLLADEWDNYEEAIRILRAGLRRAPESAMLRNNLAYVLLLKGQKTEAHRLLDSIGELSTQEELYRTATRGLLAISEGRLDEGRRLYNQAAGLAKDLATRNLVLQKKAIELARAYGRTGDRHRAQRLLEEAQSLDVPHGIYRRQAERLAQALAQRHLPPA